MISEAKTEKTTTAIAPIAADEADKIFAFSEILRKMEETDEKTVVPLLKKIEFNTSILKKIKLSGSETKAITAKGSITRTAPLSRGDDKGRFLTAKGDEAQRAVPPKGKAAKGPEVEKAQDRPVTARRVSREEVAAAAEATTEKQAEAKPVEPKEKGTKESAPIQAQAQPQTQAQTAVMPSETTRDKGGRFVGKSKSQEARAEQGDKSERRSILQSLKNGFEGIGGKGKSTLASNAGTLEEAAGRAAGGPFFEAAMELKGAVDSARDEDGMIGKAARKLGEKVGFSKKEDQTPKEGRDDKGRFLTAKGDETAKIIETLKSTENEDEKRHEELIKAILKGDKGKAGESMGLPSLRKTGPGATAKEKMKKAMKKGQSPISPRMPKVPGGGGGPGGGGLLSSLLSRFALPGMALAGAGLVGAGVGTVANMGINKVGETVTGKKDWTLGGQIYDWTHGDAATTFESGGKKTPAQAAAVVSSGKGDAGGKSYGTYQLATNRGEPGKFLKKSGYASQFDGLQTGTKEFDEKWKQMAAQDPKFAAAQKQYAVETKYDPQMKKLSDSGMDLSGKGKAVQEMVLSTANQYGAKTDVIQKALKGKDVSSMSGADIAATVQDYKAATVGQYFKSSSPEVQASVAKRTQDEKSFLTAKARMETLGADSNAPTAVATAETPIKKRAFDVAKKKKPREPLVEGEASREKAASAEVAQSPKPEMKSLEGERDRYAGAMAPVAPMAEAVAVQAPSKVQQPERIQPSVDDQPRAAKVASAGPGASGEGAASVPGMDRLIAMMTKMMSGKEGGGGAQQIRTEFDDTMLTLMAYDRV